MTTLRYAMLSALLSPLVHDEDDSEQESGARATGGCAEKDKPPTNQCVTPSA